MRARTTSTPSSSAARRPASRRSAAADTAPLNVAIDRIGHLGDGLGTAADGGSVCVPRTLPGEYVLAQPLGKRGALVLGRPLEWLTSGADRVMPPCPHFGACGGCALQHWAEAPYLLWKTDLLRQALIAAGYVDPPILPIVRTQPHERRRIELSFRCNDRAVTLGLHQAAGKYVVDLTDCVVLHPDIALLLSPLRALLARLPSAGRSGRVAINLSDTGADIVVRAVRLPNAAERTIISTFAVLHDVARVHWARDAELPEPICIHHPVTVRFAGTGSEGVEVVLPPDAFLQASSLAEAEIVKLVMDGMSGLRSDRPKLLELYAGCGTLTFALADLGPVTAYEGNPAAADALRTAANCLPPGRITCHQRDLVRQPLMARELAGFAAVVLDPPWAGAPVQIAEIAKSAVRRVVYVSCNPVALRRDAQLLQTAGFAIGAATPVDQFLWSAQLESVVVFRREP